MEFATQAEQHLLRLFEFLEIDRRQEAGGGKAGGANAIAGRPGDPDAALDVAEGTDAVLEVRLLQVRAAAGLLTTLTLGLDDRAGERFPSLT